MILQGSFNSNDYLVILAFTLKFKQIFIWDSFAENAISFFLALGGLSINFIKVHLV